MDDLTIEEPFPGITSDRLWTAWTTEGGVTSFWAERATIELEVGGAYVLGWPEWTMRGEILALDPPRSITFTWRWDHEPDEPDRRVTLAFGDDGPGSVLAIHHGPFGPDDGERRASHADGWRHFAERLRTRGD